MTSERIALLTWVEECFYRRLLSVVDDYGRFYSHPKLLRASCYPLQLDKVSDADVGRWLLAAEKAGLVSVYLASDGKRYLELLDFRQQIRAKMSKYPQAPPDAKHMLSTCVASAHLDVVEDEVVLSPNGDMSGDKPPDVDPPVKKPKVNGAHSTAAYLADAENVLTYLNHAAAAAFKFRNPNGKLTASAELVIGRLKEGYTPTQLREVVFFKCEEWRADDKMHTYLRPDTLFGKKKFEQYLGAIGGSDDRMS